MLRGFQSLAGILRKFVSSHRLGHFRKQMMPKYSVLKTVQICVCHFHVSQTQRWYFWMFNTEGSPVLLSWTPFMKQEHSTCRHSCGGTEMCLRINMQTKIFRWVPGAKQPGVKLISQLHLRPRSRIRGFIPPIQHTCSRHGTSLTKHRDNLALFLQAVPITWNIQGFRVLTRFTEFEETVEFAKTPSAGIFDPLLCSWLLIVGDCLLTADSLIGLPLWNKIEG
jgi:hypothetical protein